MGRKCPKRSIPHAPDLLEQQGLVSSGWHGCRATTTLSQDFNLNGGQKPCPHFCGKGFSSRATGWTDSPSLQFEFNEIDRGDAGVAYRTCCIRFLPNKLAEFEVNSWSGCPGSLSTIVPPLRTILMPGAFWVKAATDWPGSSTNRQPRSRSLSRTGLYSGTSERADAENRRNGVLTTTAAPSDWPDHLYTSGVDSSLMVAGDG